MRNLFFIICFSVSASSFAQVELTFFTLTEKQQKIELTWEIAQGSTCEGTIIERSTDGITFFAIGNIDGVCGSPDFAQRFDFTDENPVAFSTNYYRLLLGSSGYSIIVSIEYTFPIDLFALENPFTSRSKLYLSETEEISISFYSTSGIFLGKTQEISSVFTIGETFPNLPDGIIIFDVSNKKGERIRKKFLKIS